MVFGSVEMATSYRLFSQVTATPRHGSEPLAVADWDSCCLTVGRMMAMPGPIGGASASAHGRFLERQGRDGDHVRRGIDLGLVGGLPARMARTSALSRVYPSRRPRCFVSAPRLQ